MCVILQENRRRPQSWFRDPRGYCQGFKQKPWGRGNPGGTTAVLTPAVSVKSVKTCVVPSWAMWVALLPHKFQKREHWVKEDYSGALKPVLDLTGTCDPLSSFWNGNVYPMLVPPLYFGSRYPVWFHSFIAGEEVCLGLNHTSSFVHHWFIRDLELRIMM